MLRPVRRLGSAGTLTLALVLAVLASFAAYSSSAFDSANPPAGPAPDLAASRASWMAAIACLATLLALLASSILIGREKARRRRSELRLSQLLQGAEQTDALVTVVNRTGSIEYTNPAVEVTTGYTSRELLGRPSARWLPWYSDEPGAEAVREALLAGGSFRGLVSCRRKDGTPFLLQEHVAPLHEGTTSGRRFVSTARDITRQQEAEDRLVYLSSFDPLTGLANRGQFALLLQQALARQPTSRLAVLALDVDRFKYINDLSGPGVGDAVLRRVAEVLRSLIGPGGGVGRLGSDEFGIIRPLEGDADVEGFAHSIRGALARLAGVDAQEVPVTVSLGIARSPQDGSDAATLLKNADLALAHAKALGRDTVQLFNRELSVQALELCSLERRLASALRDGEYRVHYQPYCELTTGRVSGAEALIRWDSRDLGSVSPAKFIPALEASGLIVAVGEWVLRTACRQISDWQRARRALPVSVNLSQLQLGQHDVVGMVEDAVKEHAIDPRQLTLELTESICVRDIDFAVGLLRKLKDVGVSLSVDDFGTGYSSLSHVKKLPVDSLKIDKSFVRDVASDPDAASIITAITSMARSLGLKTIAEGVETEEQRNILRLLRCDLGQGYHFGRAVAAESFEHPIAG